MEMEHIGISVAEPIKMAQWYMTNLDFHLKFQGGNDTNGVSFIYDKSNKVMFELFSLPGVEKYKSDLAHPLKIHFAFKTANYEKDLKRLTDNGAIFIEECKKKFPGDKICLLKDPWNNVIQLVQRGNKTD